MNTNKRKYPYSSRKKWPDSVLKYNGIKNIKEFESYRKEFSRLDGLKLESWREDNQDSC